MKKLKTVLAVVLIGMMVTACDSPVYNQSTNTYVKDLVQSDVFGVLPEAEMDILVYNTSEEIEGEYLELATVEITDSKSRNSTMEVIEMLKKEAKELGGNGVLIIKQTEKEDNQVVTKEVKAIAVFALDRVPLGPQLVTL